MNRKLILGFGAILILALVGIGIYRQTNKKVEKEVIRIGSILPLTGPISDYGNDVLNGQRKAIEFLNSENREIQFELIVEDGKTGNKDALSAYNNLQLKSIKIYTAISSNIAIPLLSRIAQDTVLLFAGSSNPAINNPLKDNIFRHFVTAKQEVGLIFNDIPEMLINKTLPVIVNDDFGVGFQKEIETFCTALRPDLKTLSPIFFDKKEKSVDNLIAKIREIKPTNVIIVGYKDIAGNLVKGLKQQKLNINVYCSYSFLLTKAENVAGPESMKGIKVVDINISDSILNVYNLDLHEALDYATIRILGKAIAASPGRNVMEISKYLKEAKEVDCGIYRVKQDDAHDFAPPVILKKF